MEYINDLRELCESVSRELVEVTDKIRTAGKMSSGDLDVVDKLTHTLKSIKAVIAMMEDEDAYSNRGWLDGLGGSYRYSRYGGSYRDSGYRGGTSRGRGMNARRDSMGRYSGDGNMADELRELMQDAPNETIKRELQRVLEKVEQQ